MEATLELQMLRQGIVYLGCYRDWPYRVLPTRLDDAPLTNTPAECAQRCSDYRYAGVESGEECFCGNTMDNAKQKPESECDDPCPGNSSIMCGGDWRISVYTDWATTTTSTTPTSSHDASSESLTTVIPSTATPPITSTAASTASFSTTVQSPSSSTSSTSGKPTASPAAITTPSPTTVPSPSWYTSSTFGTRSTSEKPVVALNDSSRGASTAATAAGVSVAVALAIAAIVIVFVLRKRGKLCFAITKRSTLENTDDNHHISSSRKEFKQNDDYQGQGASFSNQTYCVVKKKGAMNTDEYCAVLEKQCGQPAHEMPSNEANLYFVLEKQTTGNTTQINTANAIELDTDDGNMYQEIDTNTTYAGVDDSREDRNDYDYTNKTFRDSNMKISDNVYSHLNSACNEYDHVGKGQSNVTAMENNYDITSCAV